MWLKLMAGDIDADEAGTALRDLGRSVKRQSPKMLIKP